MKMEKYRVGEDVKVRLVLAMEEYMVLWMHFKGSHFFVFKRKVWLVIFQRFQLSREFIIKFFSLVWWTELEIYGWEHKKQMMVVDNQGKEMQWRSHLKVWCDSDSYGCCKDLEWISRYGYNEFVGEIRAIDLSIFADNAEIEILHHGYAYSRRSEYKVCFLLEFIITTVFREYKPYVWKLLVKLIIKTDNEKYVKLELCLRMRLLKSFKVKGCWGLYLRSLLGN